MTSRTALVRYAKGTIVLIAALIAVMFLFSHFAIGDPWTEGGSCYPHPLIVQTCHPEFSQDGSTVTFTRVRTVHHAR